MECIYIVLTQTGTLFSRAIKRYTGDPYNHASLSFDSSLSKMYSFGRKRRYNMFRNGFVEEGFQKGLFSYFPQTQCCVLQIPVAKEEYVSMKRLVERFFESQEQYRYNLLGVLCCGFGKGFARENHFFCSQFVSFVLGEASFWQKDPKLTKPMDFYEIPHKTVVYEGGILEFGEEAAVSVM